MVKIILASQSAQRKILFKTLNVPFEVVPANLDEAAITDINPTKRAEKLAIAKAEKVSQLHPNAIIIAADTFVIDGKRSLEKPRDTDEAREMLKSQSGKNLLEVTGFCFINPSQSRKYSTAICTEFTFRQLNDQEIERYVSTQPVTTWSAAFSPAYPEGLALIASIKGSLSSFTHGLPIEEVTAQLKLSNIL